MWRQFAPESEPVTKTTTPPYRLSVISSPRESLKEAPVIVTPASGTKLIEAEGAGTGSIGLKVYYRYIKNVGGLFSILIMFGTIAHQAISIFANNWLSEWSVHPQVNEPETRALYLGVYGGLGGMQALLLFLSSLLTAFGAVKAARLLHNNMLHTSMRMPMSFFDTTPLGRISNR